MPRTTAMHTNPPNVWRTRLRSAAVLGGALLLAAGCVPADPYYAGPAYDSGPAYAVSPGYAPTPYYSGGVVVYGGGGGGYRGGYYDHDRYRQPHYDGGYRGGYRPEPRHDGGYRGGGGHDGGGRPPQQGVGPGFRNFFHPQGTPAARPSGPPPQRRQNDHDRR